jgi:hypothetical protein
MIKLKALPMVMFLLFHSIAAFGENIFELRLNPALPIPAGVKNFGPGFGVETALDWSFGSAGLRSSYFGLFAGAGYSQLSIEDGSGFAIASGELGPFVQYRITDRFALRGNLSAGVYQYSWGDNDATRFHAGFGVQPVFHISPYVSIFANAGYSYHIFSMTRPLNIIRIGLGVSLNISEIVKSESRIRGEKIEQRRVFPVSYAWYEHNPVATVRITNNEPNTITNVDLSFFMERYMNQPVPFANIPHLQAGESKELPVTALFNESMLDLTENMNANARVIIDYRSLGVRKQGGFSVDMPIYHRNAFVWDDDRRATSFVSARDPAAAYFAKYTVAAVRNHLWQDIPPNVQYAAALFSALHLYGISYVVDPASSYVELSENASALDTLNYPYQTLLYRAGDCDDLSILYCSLLEVLGIDTAFVTSPGHIYIAFDPGDEEWAERHKDNLIQQGEKFWVPVEITIPEDGFPQAWRTGSREWKAAVTGAGTGREEPALYPMAESWALYPPVSVPGAGDRLPVMPEEGAILRRFQESLDRLR